MNKREAFPIAEQVLKTTASLKEHTDRQIRMRAEATAQMQSDLANYLSVKADAADTAELGDDARHGAHLAAVYEHRKCEPLCEELGWSEKAAQHKAKAESHAVVVHKLGGPSRHTRLAK